MTDSEFVFEMRGINAGYHGSKVISDISFAVAAGSVVALVGPNGAGKTTLMKVGSGLLSPTSGQIFLGGFDVTKRPMYARVRAGLCDIPEGRGIFPSLSVKDNLTLQSAPKKERESIARAAEVFPVLGRKLSQIAGSLSGGEQQMLALVRAYLVEPSIVLIDEASLGLAPVIVDQVFQYVDALVKRGTAVLIVEQYVNRVLEIADNVLLLNRGSIVLSAAASEMRGVDIFEKYLGIEVGS